MRASNSGDTVTVGITCPRNGGKVDENHYTVITVWLHHIFEFTGRRRKGINQLAHNKCPCNLEGHLLDYVTEAVPKSSGRGAAGEESVSNDLRRLSPGYIVTWTEVWSVLRRDTQFSRPSAVIASHNAACSKALYPQPEGVGRWHILEGLLDGGDGRFYLRSVGYDLRGLSTGGVVLWAEVWPVVYTGFSEPAAHVSGHIAPRGETLDKFVESVIRRHILEGLARYRLGESRCIAHYLSELSTCHLVVGPESPIRVTADDATAGQTAHMRVESVVRGHICEG